MNTKIIYLIAAVSLALSINGCLNCDELSEAENNLIKKEINQLLADYLNISDDFAAQSFELFADVKGYTRAMNGEITDTTYATVRKQVQEMSDWGIKPILREFSDVHIFPLSRNAAACTFVFKTSLLDTEREDTISYGGNLTWVFKKYDNTWKVVHESGCSENY